MLFGLTSFLLLLFARGTVEIKIDTQDDYDNEDQSSMLLNDAKPFTSYESGKSLSYLDADTLAFIDDSHEETIPTTKKNTSIVEPKRILVIPMSRSHSGGQNDTCSGHIRMLDMYHRQLAEDFKSPITSTFVGTSFIEFNTDYTQHLPKYGKHLRNYFNTQYSAKIAVGTPDNLFSFIVDTGSGTTLLNDQRCGSPDCRHRNQFDAQKSQSYRSFGKLVRINYAKGGVIIELGKDDFFYEDLKITDMEFGSILQEEGLFDSVRLLLIVGLL